jgi:hypothetical protein
MASVLAQDAAPSTGRAADAPAVRVRIGYVCGLCGGLGYRTSFTTVEPTFIISELKDATDKKTRPDTKTKRAITRKEWEELQRSIDAKALKALPQPATCRPCIDLPDFWVTVEYSDGQRISVSYEPTNPPAPINALLRKVPTIQIRLKP